MNANVFKNFCHQDTMKLFQISNDIQLHPTSLNIIWLCQRNKLIFIKFNAFIVISGDNVIY